MHLLMIAKNNIMRKKSNAVILFILVTIAAMLLYTGISVLSRMGTFLEEKSEKQNGSHCTLITSPGYDQEILSILNETKGFEKAEAEDCLITANSEIRNTTQNKKAATMSLVLFDMEHERSISNLEIVDRGETLKANSIIIPAYMKVAKGYQTGDRMEMKIGDKTYVFEVYGFIEDVMFATPSNVSIYKCMIPSGKFMEFKNNNTVGVLQRNYQVRLEDGSNSSEYEEIITKKLDKQITDASFVKNLIINFATMSYGTSMFISILMAVVTVFAILIVLISMVVIRFSIVTNIENNIANIGILESLGYTSGQLRKATLIEFISIAVLGCGAGLLCAGFSSRLVAGIVSASIGLLWNSRPDLLAGVISVILVLIVVAGISFVTGFKYREITPLSALRNGIHTHNFKRNYVSLHKSKIGLHSSLGLKEILHNKKQNAAVIVIVALLSFTCVMTFCLYYNFVFDITAMVQMVGLEKPNVSVSSKNQQEGEVSRETQEIIDAVTSRAEVERYVNYNTKSITFTKGDKELSLQTDICSDTGKLSVDTIIKGRRPEYDNEISVTNVVIKKLGAKLGDVIYAEANGVRQDYIIVGISQHISNLGLRVLMTDDGYKRMEESYNGTAKYLYLKKGTDVKKFVDKMTDLYGDEFVEIANFDEHYNTVMSSFIGGLRVLCGLFVGITLIVITLIIFMLVKMKLLKDKKMMGIYKAFGYTTGQLILQTAMSFAPVISVGGLLGVVCGRLFINQSFAAMLSNTGIESADLKIPVLILIGTFAAITILAYAIVVLSSLKIRKIEPYRMIVEG